MYLGMYMYICLHMHHNVQVYTLKNAHGLVESEGSYYCIMCTYMYGCTALQYMYMYVFSVHLVDGRCLSERLCLC
jgi:hypothetical protein